MCFWSQELELKRTKPVSEPVATSCIDVHCCDFVYKIANSDECGSERKTKVDIRHGTFPTTQEDNTCHWVLYIGCPMHHFTSLPSHAGTVSCNSLRW